MPATCEEITTLLAPYAEDALEGDDLDRVSAHLSRCEPCRTTASRGREALSLLRAGQAGLKESASVALRLRIQAAAAPAKPVVVPFAPRRRRVLGWVPLSAAAAVLLAVAGVFAVGAFSERGSVLAAQLTLDHLKCLWLADRQPGADPHALAERWQSERGWAIAVPGSSEPHDVRLVSLRRCLFGDGEMAHLIYEHRGETISLFILPRAREAAPVLAIMGHETVTWTGGGRTYALVAAAPRAELAGLVDYFQPATR